MSFQDDIDTDRSAVFLDAAGSGFAESVTYTTTAGVATTITAVSIEQIFAIFDNKQSRLYHVSAGDVAAPVRGDRITRGADTFQVADVQTVDGMWELRCARMQDTQ